MGHKIRAKFFCIDRTIFRHLAYSLNFDMHTCLVTRSASASNTFRTHWSSNCCVSLPSPETMRNINDRRWRRILISNFYRRKYVFLGSKLCTLHPCAQVEFRKIHINILSKVFFGEPHGEYRTLNRLTGHMTIPSPLTTPVANTTCRWLCLSERTLYERFAHVERGHQQFPRRVCQEAHISVGRKYKDRLSMDS